MQQQIISQQETMVIEIDADYRRRRFKMGWAGVIILTMLSMGLLTIIQEPLGWSRLAWFALVPWVVAVCGAGSGWRMAGINLVLGFGYYLGNLSWLSGVTTAGWVGLCFYLAWYFVISGFVLRQIYIKRRWPFTLVLPLVWTCQEYLRGIALSGFPWLFLGHSQHEHIQLIQISDLFGVYGITFLIAMVNGLVCDILLRPLGQKQNHTGSAYLSIGPLLLLTACVGIGTILYGKYRLGEGADTITKGPVVTVIQDSIAQKVKESGQSNEEIFSRYYARSEQALSVEPKADLLVWPETMVPGPLNKELMMLQPSDVNAEGVRMLQECQSYYKRLAKMAAEYKVALLVGAPGLELKPNGKALRYNSAFLFKPDGSLYSEHYDKMHLVPFGESVPFKKSFPALHNLLNRLTPYDFDYTLEEGTNPTIFPFRDRAGREQKFVVAICYEDVMPQVARQLLKPERGRKRADFLINISNDGWFVRGNQDKGLRPTWELIQHLVICQFRAIENRVGIARAVNTGISAFIKPDGRIQGQSLVGTLPSRLRRRECKRGYLTDNVYIDSRVSMYSFIGDTFAIACSVLTGLLLLSVLIKKGPKSSHQGN